ncbi:coil containing protein [Vibrio phage 1.091.O._10N.286.52.B12]|nr:coil containing protein [Vibrio phage 1.091.O._10N.286.52.B12]
MRFILNMHKEVHSMLNTFTEQNMTSINKLTQTPTLEDNDLSVVWQNSSGRTRAITIENLRHFIQSTDPNADAFVRAELVGDELILTAHDETETRIDINILPDHSVTELKDMPDTLVSGEYLKVNDAGNGFVLTPASETSATLLVRENGQLKGAANVLDFGNATISLANKIANIKLNVQFANTRTMIFDDNEKEYLSVDRTTPVIVTEEIDSLVLCKTTDPESETDAPKVRKASVGELASGFSVCPDGTSAGTQILQASSGTYSLTQMTFAVGAAVDDSVYIGPDGKLTLDQSDYVVGWVLTDGVIIDIDLYNATVTSKSQSEDTPTFKRVDIDTAGSGNSNFAASIHQDGELHTVIDATRELRIKYKDISTGDTTTVAGIDNNQAQFLVPILQGVDPVALKKDIPDTDDFARKSQPNAFTESQTINNAEFKVRDGEGSSIFRVRPDNNTVVSNVPVKVNDKLECAELITRIVNSPDNIVNLKAYGSTNISMGSEYTQTQKPMLFNKIVEFYDDALYYGGTTQPKNLMTKEAVEALIPGDNGGEDSNWHLLNKVSYESSTVNTESTGQGTIHEFLGSGSTSAVHTHTFNDSGVVWIANFQVSSARDKTVEVKSSVSSVGMTGFKIPVNMITRFSYCKETNKMYSEASYIRPELIDFTPNSDFNAKSGYDRVSSGGGSTHRIEYWENGTIFKISNSKVEVHLLEGMNSEDSKHGYVKYINSRNDDVTFEWYDRNGNRINNSTVPSTCPANTVVDIFANYDTDDYFLTFGQSIAISGSALEEIVVNSEVFDHIDISGFDSENTQLKIVKKSFTDKDLISIPVELPEGYDVLVSSVICKVNGKLKKQTFEYQYENGILRVHLNEVCSGIIIAELIK